MYMYFSPALPPYPGSRVFIPRGPSNSSSIFFNAVRALEGVKRSGATTMATGTLGLSW